jgi:hypothetical protein
MEVQLRTRDAERSRSRWHEWCIAETQSATAQVTTHGCTRSHRRLFRPDVATAFDGHLPLHRQRVDTGYELADIPAVALPHILVGCTECGQDHMWRIEDAFAES